MPIDLAGEVTAVEPVELRGEAKELAESFDVIEAEAFLAPEKLRQLLTEVRIKTFTALRKVGTV